ncbi:envelope stress response membrane protein PspC [Aliidiomarina celeris]|uniref:envelope stress response membrane protein PspC n=1 Tax=Aliidiomarina celeris TaxID=2249428 RepID=UPI000DE8D579|nr:envelope stress response membrane protein PspC [Aliidiomarina celeris]
MSERKREMFRDEKQGKIAGVCAGLAQYFGWELWVVRIIAVTALIFATKLTAVAYIVAWVVIEKKPKGSTIGGNIREETKVERTRDGRTIEIKTKVWESGKPPKMALVDLHDEFSSMEGTLRAMERYVTSAEFRIKNEINRL